MDKFSNFEGITEMLKQVENVFPTLFDEAFANSKHLKKNKINLPSVSANDTDEQKATAFSGVMQILADANISLDEGDLNSFAEFFTNLYSEGYRHRYSAIYVAIMRDFLKESNYLDSGVPLRARILSENILHIKNHMASQEKYASTNAYRSICKLHDHIELEHHRMRYMTMQSYYYTEQIKELKDKTEESTQLAQKDLEEKIQQAKQDFDKNIKASRDEYEAKTIKQVEESSKSLQRNHVTILGIFAAIVIAFMSDAVFSSSVLENMNNVSIHRLSFVMVFLGFFSFNLLVALFYFVLRVSSLDFEGKETAKKFVLRVDGAIVFVLALIVFDRVFHILPLV